MLRDVSHGTSRVGGLGSAPGRAGSLTRRGFEVAGVFLALALLASLTVGAAGAEAKKPSIEALPMAFEGSKFSFRQHEYVARCEAQTSRLRVHGAPGWRVRTGAAGFHGGGGSTKLVARAGKRTTVSFRRGKHGRIRSYDVRCLPNDFPRYSFRRAAPGGPGYFAVTLGDNYGAFFDRHGVPVWWYRANGGAPANLQVLADGTVAFDPAIDTLGTGYQIRTLSGRLLHRPVGSEGQTPEVHDIQLLDNGNYLIGLDQQYTADTSAFGGSADSEVRGLKLEEVKPNGKVVWQWSSRDHIGLAETGRWWDLVNRLGQPYDVVHWNAEQLDGRLILISFRHLDAIYAIDRKTGRIVWKLGGTQTPQSLRVRHDPQSDYPLGGQHDVRVQPNGTVTIHDNATGLGFAPRAVRYRIDCRAKTATLVESIDDPAIPTSSCCGSARLLNSGDWLIDWGGTNVVRSYASDGSRLFTLRLHTFSYRANPIAPGLVDRRMLRDAMDAIARRSKAG